MCGILVAFSPEGCDKLNSKLVESLCKLEHRGPDNTSFFSDENVFLGHTRLSIIDTHVNANQPLFYENLVMVYNGEVFNYVEIREELIAKGYSFTTGSDSEVVLKAYHCFGFECFEKFNGMWSIAVYDNNKKELMVSRDRFGQKPLFVSMLDGVYYFSSEIQSISNLIDVKPNYGAIQSFLKEGDFRVNGNTFFSGVFEFPKSTCIQISYDLSLEQKKYWDYPEKDNVELSSVEEFHSLLEDSVSIRLRTDVDYSLLLSGGCDSTLVAGITRELVGDKKDLMAFTYSSKDKDDELVYAKEVSDKLGIDLKVSCQDNIPEDYVARLRRLVQNLGRGHSSPAIVSIDYLYQNVRECGHKVALDGQGADELLAGYKHYHLHLLLDLLKAREWSQILPLLKDIKAEGVKGILIMCLRNSLPSEFRKILRILFGYEKYFKCKEKFVLEPHCLEYIDGVFKGTSSLNAYLYKQHTEGLSNLLYYGDIVAMNNSVENRSPFMDHRLVEMAFSSNFTLKVDKGSDKAVLRKHSVYKKFRDVLERKKVGFSSDISTQTKKEMVRQLRNSPILSWPIFDAKEIKNFLDSEVSLSEKYERFLFRLFQVCLWEEEFLKP